MSLIISFIFSRWCYLVITLCRFLNLSAMSNHRSFSQSVNSSRQRPVQHLCLRRQSFVFDITNHERNFHLRRRIVIAALPAQSFTLKTKVKISQLTTKARRAKHQVAVPLAIFDSAGNLINAMKKLSGQLRQ